MRKNLRTWKDFCGCTLGYIGEFYGINGVALINHGGWADPELYYNEKSYNYYDVENYMWEEFHEGNPDGSRDDFAVWMKEHGDDVKALLSDLDELGAYFKGTSFVVPC